MQQNLILIMISVWKNDCYWVIFIFKVKKAEVSAQCSSQLWKTPLESKADKTPFKQTHLGKKNPRLEQ